MTQDRLYDAIVVGTGISGGNLGLSQLPNGNFHLPINLNCVETDFKMLSLKKIEDGRLVTIGRTAHITYKNAKIKGRNPCQYRNRCRRGCPSI